MATTAFRAASLTKHIHVRNFLTCNKISNVCEIHTQSKGLLFHILMGNSSLHKTFCINTSSQSLFLRNISHFLHSNLSSQSETSSRINNRFGRTNSNLWTTETGIRSSCFFQVRQKSKSGRQNSNERDNEEEEDSDEEDDALDDNDFEAPGNFKVLKMNVPSMRTDAVISHALDIGRNNLEEVFLGSKLYLNGSKLLKKSEKMDVGDYADVVIEKEDDQLKVKRVKVLKIYPEKTNKEKLILKVRIWKTPFLIAKPEN